MEDARCYGIEEPAPQTDEDLDVAIGHIELEELYEAAGELKSMKACGLDDVLPEIWKAVCLPASDLSTWVLDLTNSILHEEQLPSSWHIAKI